jgi:hypothetical protein
MSASSLAIVAIDEFSPSKVVVLANGPGHSDAFGLFRSIFGFQ